MRTITIVYERHHYLYRWLKPMFAARKEFRALSYKLEYQNLIDYLPIFKGQLQKKMERKSIQTACQRNYDIVMMAFHHSTSDLCQMAEGQRVSEDIPPYQVWTGNLARYIKVRAK